MKKTDKTTEAEICQLGRQGMAVNDIIRQTGKKYDTVRAVLTRNGFVPRRGIDHVIADYRPERLYFGDEESLTDKQRQEQAESLRRVFTRKIELEMTEVSARAILEATASELMVQMNINSSQAVIVREIATRFIQRLTLARQYG